MMKKTRRKKRNVCVHSGDGRANAVPTVLWLANLEVPGLQLREGREKKQNWSDRLPYNVVASRCMFEPWEKFHVVVIFILK